MLRDNRHIVYAIHTERCGGWRVPGPFYVYCLFRPDGRPFYVGKGKGNRFIRHEQVCNLRGDYKSRIIVKAQRDELEIPKVVLRSNLTESEAFSIECAFIKAVGRRPHGPLVNATEGGEGRSGRGQFRSEEHNDKIRLALLGHELSTETRAKISAVFRGRPSLWNKGKSLSDEHKAKLRAAKLGRKLPKEHKARISASLLGITRSQETRARMSLARKLASSHQVIAQET